MKLDNAFQMKEPDADSRILAFRDRTVYLKNEGEITFLKYHVWVEYCKTHHKKVPGLVYLFSVDDISFYLTELYEDVEIPGFMYHKLFAVRSMKPKERVFAATTAWHLYWYFKAFALTGRQVCSRNYPGRCPGLRASAPSGRVGKNNKELFHGVISWS